MLPNLEKVAIAICQSNEFEFIKSVGGGSFKETFHIKDKNGFSEALKVFKSGNTPERSDREIEAMIKCNHPNIGELKYVSKIKYANNEYLFMVEEYLAGGTLSKRIEKKLLPIKDVFILGSGLISAVNHIALQYLVHRDIKPDNIMFREDGLTPVIVDFGLVRDLMDESLTHTWLVQGPGSPYYASPEQLNNQKGIIDWRTDQFALGVLLSLCCFGVHPYGQNGDNPSDIVMRVARRENLNRDFISKAIKTGLEPLIKMVAQWPIGRFRTPKDLINSWGAVTQG